MSTILSQDERALILTTCAAHGLEITNAQRKGVMLELQPASLDALPSAQALRTLDDALDGDGVRYVTLALDDTDTGSLAADGGDHVD